MTTEGHTNTIVAAAGAAVTGAGWLVSDLSRLDMALRITNSSICIVLGTIALGKVCWPVIRYLWNRIRRS